MIDAGVAGLRVVTADRSVFDIYRGRIVVSDSPAIREAALAVSATIKAAVRLSAIAPVTAMAKLLANVAVLMIRLPPSAKIAPPRAPPPSSERVTTQAGRAKGIATVAAGRSCEMEGGVGHGCVTEAIKTATIRRSRQGSAPLPPVPESPPLAAVFSNVVLLIVAVPAADPHSAALGRTTKATISLTVLILVATVAAIRSAVVDSRAVDVERAAF